MTLGDYRSAYYELSGTASTVSRQVAFAGIALIWIFRSDTTGSIALPVDLLWPALFFVIGLALDLLQYVVASAIWGGFARYEEMKGTGPAVELAVPPYFNWPALACYWGKVLAVIVGYFFLLAYLKSSIHFL